MPTNDDHFALVIGIDDYPEFRSLRGAKQDAKDFAGWLMDTSIGGGIPGHNVKLVLSNLNPVRPIHEDVDDALQEIFDETETAPAKRLYLYFSGHGLARSNIGADLCLAKWSMKRKGRALDSNDYLDLTTGSGHFKEVVMFLDCCRVRKIRRRALTCTLDISRPSDSSGNSRSFVGYATEFLSAAHEATLESDFSDDDDHNPIIRGHFTRALIDALSGKAARNQGGVTATRLKEYLEVHTPEIAKAAGHVQKPEIQNGLDSGSESIFGSAVPTESEGVTVNISFGASCVGDIVLEDGKLKEIKKGPVSSAPWVITDLKRGGFWLTDLGRGEGMDFRIEGDESEEINVHFE